MPEAKTKPTDVSVRDYIASVEHEGRRADAEVLLPLFQKATGWKAAMWGPSIIGFGRYDYTYDSGHSGASCVTGFSPRKANMAIYIMPGVGTYPDLLARLGKHKHTKSCLYVGRLDSIDLGVLEKLIRAGVADMKKKWPVSPA